MVARLHVRFAARGLEFPAEKVSALVVVVERDVVNPANIAEQSDVGPQLNENGALFCHAQRQPGFKNDVRSGLPAPRLLARSTLRVEWRPQDRPFVGREKG